MKKHVRVSFYHIACIAGIIAIGGLSCCSIRRGKRPSDESPSESFEEQGNAFILPDFVE